MNGGILTVSHLSVGYGERPAAADVSFSLQRGEILCLVGESGCGSPAGGAGDPAFLRLDQSGGHGALRTP